MCHLKELLSVNTRTKVYCLLIFLFKINVKYRIQMAQKKKICYLKITKQKIIQIYKQLSCSYTEVSGFPLSPLSYNFQILKLRLVKNI